MKWFILVQINRTEFLITIFVYSFICICYYLDIVHIAWVARSVLTLLNETDNPLFFASHFYTIFFDYMIIVALWIALSNFPIKS